MKSVLISIQPKWCELIASGKKSVEVRKTKPKIETPFKVYIYQTKTVYISKSKENDILVPIKQNMGKVIGEFMCDRIEDMRDVPQEFTCLTVREWLSYTVGFKGIVWGWHIKDLVIYDKPKELREFYTRCYSGCDNCKYKSWDYDLGGGKDIICIVSNKKPIERPPQSWCYVEGVEGE